MRRALLLGGLAAAGALWAVARSSSATASASPVDALETVYGDVLDTLGADGAGQANVAAFLAMISYSEGADYNTLYGGGTFASYADHPRVAVTAGGRTSTAAGRYQILARTWDDFVASQGPHDFSPASQDACAVWLIRRRGALADVRAGRFAAAVAKCAEEWASLPGSPYGQPTHELAQVQAVYENAGGLVA